MVTGAHTTIYSVNPVADRAFLRDVIGLTHVDVGHGWLIFGLPRRRSSTAARGRKR